MVSSRNIPGVLTHAHTYIYSCYVKITGQKDGEFCDDVVQEYPLSAHIHTHIHTHTHIYIVVISR